MPQTLDVPRPGTLDTHTDTDAVVISHLTKRFGAGAHWPWQAAKAPVYALTDISLTVAHGEILGLLGANGSGKSTLIRILSTLILPDEGSATIFGHDVVQDDTIVKRLINRVSVEASFFKKLSAIENLLYACRLYGRSGESRRDIVRTLGLLGVTRAQAERPLETMSRGMQQKVAIARALLTAPVLLLLDEPTTGLDPQSKQEVQRFVRDIRASHDATVFLCTHDMAEAEQLADRLAVLAHGNLVALDTPDALKARFTPPGGATRTLEEVFISLTGSALEAAPI